MVYYTPQFEQQFSNPLSIIKSYVALTNDVFRKSGLGEVKVKLHCIEKIAIMDNELEDTEDRLNEFRDAKGKDNLSSLLNSADMALLMTASGVGKFRELKHVLRLGGWKKTRK